MGSLTMTAGHRAPEDGTDVERPPAELLTLRERIHRMAPAIQAELVPMVEEAIEEARFRGRILTVARDALIRLRLDLAMAQFNLDATRTERAEPGTG